MDDIDMTRAQPVATAHPFPTIWKSIGWIVLFFFLQIVFSIAAIMSVVDYSQGTETMAGQMADLKLIALPTIWSLVASNIVTLGLLWLYVRKPERLAKLGLDRWSTQSLGRTMIVAVLLISAGLAFNYLYETYVVPDVKLQEQLRLLFAAIPSTIPNKILLLVAAALLAPVVEELLFRGLLQNALADRMPIWIAILISASVFGAVHMDYHAFPVLAGMGIVFGVLYHLTGSLRVTILAHMINNSAALLLT